MKKEWCFSICVTVLVLNIHFRTPETHKMAPWVRKVFIHILPRLLNIKRPYFDKDKHRCWSNNNKYFLIFSYLHFSHQRFLRLNFVHLKPLYLMFRASDWKTSQSILLVNTKDNKHSPSKHFPPPPTTCLQIIICFRCFNNDLSCPFQMPRYQESILLLHTRGELLHQSARLQSRGSGELQEVKTE